MGLVLVAVALVLALRRPWDAAVLLVTPSVKWHTLLLLLAPTGLLALGSPYLLLGVPLLAQRLLNDRPQLWGTDFHYSSVLAPVVVFAAVDTLGRLLPRVRRPQRVLRAWPPGVCVEVDDRVAPQLTSRDHVTIAGVGPSMRVLAGPPGRHARGRDATWLVLDLSQERTMLIGPEPRAYLRDAHRRSFRIVREANPIVVLRRPAPVLAHCRTP